MLRFDKVEPVGIHPICLVCITILNSSLKRLTSTPIVVISKVLNTIMH